MAAKVTVPAPSVDQVPTSFRTGAIPIMEVWMKVRPEGESGPATTRRRISGPDAVSTEAIQVVPAMDTVASRISPRFA